ncbi:hypothetical protein [Polyangium jinanense]|uniref:Uncharacterized protein n=1 Tax=Polyangium jinanense TaxID=2829994 RepID=A0A9X4AYA5_9BACT|nr:hypothetical protein [Polyangium jinanense]MDC3956998.1 hypothetical protein [Polyangium jinanense]MDC3987155.1 hypothetical protein [Polyangium jinanense]
MTKRRPAERSRGAGRRSVDRDGVVLVELRRGGLPMGPITLGLVAAGIVAFLSWKWQAETPAEVASGTTAKPGQTTEVRAPARPKGAPTLRLATRAAPAADVAPNARVIGVEDPDPEGEDVPDEASASDDPAGNPGTASKTKTGIHAFPAPGTKRIKQGLVVPDDFPLPPGYVRHYQATDKGRMLEPILLYHPDYELVDANGKVIPIPPDRVVPPDMAPEGLPLASLEVPADAYADRDERGPASNADPGQTGVEEEKPADEEP